MSTTTTEQNTSTEFKGPPPHIIRATGEIELFSLPITLEELQRHVGGYIEYCPMPRGSKIDFIVNEEGRIRDFPYNTVASEIYKAAWLAVHKEEELDLSMLRLYGDIVVLPTKTSLGIEEEEE
jgi:hypothetical protein